MYCSSLSLSQSQSQSVHRLLIIDAVRSLVCVEKKLYRYPRMYITSYLNISRCVIYFLLDWIKMHRSLLRSAFHFLLLSLTFACARLSAFFSLHEFCLSKTHWPMRTIMYVCMSVYWLQESRWLCLLFKCLLYKCNALLRVRERVSAICINSFFTVLHF